MIHGEVIPQNILTKNTSHKIFYPPIFLNENRNLRTLQNTNKLYVSPDLLKEYLKGPTSFEKLQKTNPQILIKNDVYCLA